MMYEWAPPEDYTDQSREHAADDNCMAICDRRLKLHQMHLREIPEEMLDSMPCLCRKCVKMFKRISKSDSEEILSERLRLGEIRTDGYFPEDDSA
jgi:hypothetical protein